MTLYQCMTIQTILNSPQSTNFDDKQSNKAEFVGDAAFTDGTSEVTVIYPYKETDPTVLELPAEIEQTSDVPELKNTMFMAGKGKLNGNK